MHLIGRGRYAREVYPEGRLVAAGAALARAFTPNVEASFMVGVANTPTGVLVLAVDVTPLKTGVLAIAGSFGIQTSAPDLPSLVLEYVAPLTAIAGGTLVSGATGVVVAHPTSTTPVDTTGSTAIAVPGQTFPVLGENVAALTFAATVQAVRGQRTGIVVRGISINSTTWTVGGSFSVLEQP
jgi:hypothetical protein